MTAYLIIALALCVVCILFTLGLAKAASRESRGRELSPWLEENPGIRSRLELRGGKVVALYVCESKATRTSGCVWKYDYTGPQFSSTGFDGPYKRVEDMLP